MSAIDQKAAVESVRNSTWPITAPGQKLPPSAGYFVILQTKTFNYPIVIAIRDQLLIIGTQKMNVKLITRTISNTLIVSILTLVLMPASFAKRGGGGKPPPEPEPVETSCIEYASPFPAFAVKQLKYGRKGSVSGYDILLSNQDGGCTVKLVSVSDNSDQIDLKLKFDSSSGMVIWRQTNDEKASRKSGGERFDVIRSINFQVIKK